MPDPYSNREEIESLAIDPERVAETTARGEAAVVNSADMPLALVVLPSGHVDIRGTAKRAMGPRGIAEMLRSIADGLDRAADIADGMN